MGYNRINLTYGDIFLLIRELEIKDINEIGTLIIRYKKEMGRELSNQEVLKIRELLISLIDKEDSITLVCEIDKTIQGYINAHILNFPLLCGKECYVSDLLVNENIRGKGIGKKLIESLSKYAKSNNCNRLMLNNPKESKSYERSFYSKNGFTERTNFANFVLSL